MSGTSTAGAARVPLMAPTADVALAAGLTLLAGAEVALGLSSRLWPDAAIAAFVTVPVAVRRTLPLVGTLTICGALLLFAATGGKNSQYIFLLVAVLVMLYSLGAYGSGRQRGIGLALALAAAITSALADKGHGVSDAIFAAGVVGVPWTVGVISHRRERATSALRDHTEQLEREQAARERAAVAAERDRIARELHDIVAHAVTLMVLQANAGDRQLDSDPRAAHQAFAVIRDSGKSALAELRRMLELLHGDRPADGVTPQPSLADIELLVERARRAGIGVDLHLDLDRDVPESVGVAAYRLVQEALTNANRHAHGAQVRVQVSRHDDALRVSVLNGRGEPLPDAEGSGYGLAGMRERVKVFGGRLSACGTDDGGFSVEVILPLERPS